MISHSDPDLPEKPRFLASFKSHLVKLIVVALLGIVALIYIAVGQMTVSKSLTGGCTFPNPPTPCGGTTVCSLGFAGGGLKCLYNQDYNGHLKCSVCP